MPRLWTTSDAEMEAIVGGRHGDPFKVLGLHKVGGDWIARTFVPGAEAVEVVSLSGKPLGRLERRHEAGFLEGKTRHFLLWIAAHGSSPLPPTLLRGRGT